MRLVRARGGLDVTVAKEIYQSFRRIKPVSALDYSAAFAEMTESLQHSMRLVPESQRYTLPFSSVACYIPEISERIYIKFCICPSILNL